MAVQFDRTSDVAYGTDTQRNITNESSQLGEDAFLQLLVTQMKYQDPLNPADNKESIAQMAQFSSLEQMTNLNDSFDKILALQNGASLASSAQYVGKYAVVDTGDGMKEGTVLSVSFKDGETFLKVQNSVNGEVNSFNLKELVEVAESKEARDAEVLEVETVEEEIEESVAS